jgi:iron only hydrogenase large subunit-like protein
MNYERLNNNLKELEEKIKREYEEDLAHDKEVLLEIQKNVSENMYNDIMEYLSECECCEGTLELVDSPPKFDAQNENEYLFKKAWVDQRVGICGDDYHGYIWIPIESMSKYLMFYFSM